MIKIRIRYDDNGVGVRFPISESELYAKLAEIHAIEGKDAPNSAFVTEVYWPEEFSMLTGRFSDLDEINYLAKRMDSFDELEMDQFLILCFWICLVISMMYTKSFCRSGLSSHHRESS